MSSSRSSSDEGAAISLLKRAVELDSLKRWSESLVCYKEGLKILMEVIRVCTDSAKKSAFRRKATDYMSRAETLQRQLDALKKAGQFHEQVKIEDGETGHSYDTLFGRFLDAGVARVVVEDPYVRSHHQIMNFLRICELLVRRCSSLKRIDLLTGQENSSQGHAEQKAKFLELQKDLEARSIGLTVEYSDTLHDREIRLDTGWVIKIGRGLDLYKPPRGRTVIGYFDMELRQCHETTVDVFHRENAIKTRKS